MKERTYKQWLVLNWKTGDSRTRKRNPDYSDLGKNELPAKLKMTVQIPEPEVPTLSLQIQAPEAQVHQAVLEALGEDELPGWTDAVADVVGEYEITGDDPEIDQLADAITTQALMRIESRPDPKMVREYVHDFLQEVREDD